MIGELIECEGVAQGLDAYRLKQFGHRLYSAGIAESSDQIGIERRKACDHDHIPVKILLAKPAGDLDPVHANHDHIHHHHRGFFRLEGLGEFAPICRDPRAIAKAFRISGAAAEITLEQLNADAAPMVVPAEHGMVDMVVRRQELRDILVRVIGLLINTSPTGDVLAIPPAAPPAPVLETPAD